MIFKGPFQPKALYDVKVQGKKPIVSKEEVHEHKRPGDLGQGLSSS